MKQLVFLISYGFSKRDEDRFFIKDYVHNGVCVSVFDTTKIFYPSLFKNNDFLLQDLYNYKQFTSFSELKKNIISLKHDAVFVILMQPSTFRTKATFYFLKKNNIEYMDFVLGLMPIPKYKSLQKFKRIPFGKILSKCKRIFYSLLFFTFMKPNVKYISSYSGLVGKNVVYANSLDYDKFLSKNNFSKKVDRYVVFLDQFLPFHQDNYISWYGCIEYIAEDYYKNLNNFFSYIEKKYCCKVVVSSHPCSDINKNRHFFKNFGVEFGNTIDLVENAFFVIAHDSTSCSFAVLYKKPIIFVNMEILDKYFGHNIRCFADFLGREVLYLDDFLKDPYELNLEVDLDRYEKYVRTFLSPNLSTKKTYEIVIDNVLKKDG